MRNLKTYTLVLAIIMMISMVFAGCGQKPATEPANKDQASSAENKDSVKEEKKEEAPPAENKTVTITYSFWGDKNESALKQELIKIFEEQNPNIKVKGSFTDGGTYPTKLQTYFSSNTAPDVISIAGDILSEFAKKGVFEDLTPFMDKDGVLSNTWSENSLDTFRHDGKIIAAPYIYKIPAVVYNKKIFDEAGIPYPTNNWTEDEMRELAKKLTKGSGQNKIWGMNLGWWTSVLGRNLYGTPYYSLEEKKIFAEGNEQFKHGLEFFTEMITKDKTSPDDKSSASIGGGFETGKFAMAITAPWEMSNFQKLIGDKFGWELVQLPSHPTYGSWKAPIFSDGIGISANSKQKDAAWELVKWTTTHIDSMRKSSEIGVPALLSYAKSDEYLKQFSEGWKPYNEQVFVDMLNNGVAWHTTGVWAKINDEFSNEYQKIINEKSTVDQMIKALQEKGTGFLAKEQ